MKMTHFQALILFALVTSLVFAFLSKQAPRERIRYAIWSFLAFVVIALAIGWLMFPFSR